MYRKVLVPLDGSWESEAVFTSAPDDIAPDSELILLHVIPPGRERTVGKVVLPAAMVEENARREAMAYLRDIVSRLRADPDRCRREVVVDDEVADAVVAFARRENVDLIMMYTHDRKGVAGIIKRSVASYVRRWAPIKVRVVTPRETTQLRAGS